MSLASDKGDERRTRVDLMIDEFRQAQSKRLATAATLKGSARVVEFSAQRPRAASRVDGCTPYVTRL